MKTTKPPISKFISPAEMNAFFPEASTRSQNRKLQIVETAIREYSRNGIESVRFADIAKACGVSRTLIQHYFAKPEDLTMAAVTVIRSRLTRFAVEAVARHASPREKLRAYLHGTYDWLEAYPSEAAVWLLFYYYCAIKDDFRALNTELLRQGSERIQALLAAGETLGEFRIDGLLPVRAKLIQNTLTGGLLMASSETKTELHAEIRKATVRACMQLVGSE